MKGRGQAEWRLVGGREGPLGKQMPVVRRDKAPDGKVRGGLTSSPLLPLLGS